MNVILAKEKHVHVNHRTNTHSLPSHHEKRNHSQIRIHPRHARLRDALRKRREPPLRLPLERVVAPDVPVDVRAQRPDQDLRALGHEDLLERLPIRGGDRAREWEDAVLLRAEEAREM